MARGKDGLYRRDGTLAFRYKDPDGKWREKYCGTRDRQTARDFRDDFLRDLKQGALPGEMAEWRLDQAEEWWIEYRKLRTAENTQNSERYRLQHFRKILGNLKLREVTNRHLDDYVSGRLAADIGAHSINKEVRLWSLILRKAKAWKRLADDYKPLKTKVSDIGRALTREQLRELAVVAATDVDWEAAFYGSVLAANTGLRGGELKKLKIGAIDLENRRLRIARADAKTDASARHIELNSDATEAAARLLLRASKLKPAATEPKHYLLPKSLSRITHGKLKGGRGYDPLQHQVCWDTAWRSLTNSVRCPTCRLLQQPTGKCRGENCGADMKDLRSAFVGLRFHDLRGTFITHMVERGVPLGTVQAFVGHMSARMLRHYTHISSGAARRAVELLDADPILARTIVPTKPKPVVAAEVLQ
jgi:integrase